MFASNTLFLPFKKIFGAKSGIAGLLVRSVPFLKIEWYMLSLLQFCFGFILLTDCGRGNRILSVFEQQRLKCSIVDVPNDYSENMCIGPI
jgi:hypothetical protein